MFIESKSLHNANGVYFFQNAIFLGVRWNYQFSQQGRNPKSQYWLQ